MPGSPSEVPPFPFADPTPHIFSGPVEAMRAGALAAGLGPGDEVLVPSGFDGASGQGLRAAGVKALEYRTGPGLAPSEDALDEMSGTRVRGLLLVHHLGFPQDCSRWHRWCQERSLLLLEDAVTAWLCMAGGQPVGSAGEVAVVSPAHTLGLPVGAVLVVGDSRRLADAPRARAPLLAAIAPLLRRAADPHVAAIRRAHYGRLLECLGSRVPNGYRELPDGAAPFVFPIEADDSDRLRARLAEAEIEAPRLNGFSRAVIGLPVHQALVPRDVDAIVAATACRSNHRRPRGLRVEPVADPPLLAPEWNRLAEESRNVFSSWEFASTWWRHFGSSGCSRIHAVRDRDGRLLAVLPLYRSVIRGVPMLAFLGHGVADQVGPVCGARARPSAADALEVLLRSGSAAAPVLVGHRVAADEGWDALLGARVLKRETSPVLDIAGQSWEEFLGRCSSNLRGQIRGRERKLIRERGLRFRLVSDPGELDGAFELLVSLHDARWGGDSNAFGGRRLAFHREFAGTALRRGWLRLWLAELDGEAAAAWYGFRFAGVESYYQSGREPALERTSIGFVLLAHTIREAMQDGQSEYRFLRGPEPYKRRFATRDAPVDTIVHGHGPMAASLTAMTRAAVHLPPARRVLTRAAG